MSTTDDRKMNKTLLVLKVQWRQTVMYMNKNNMAITSSHTLVGKVRCSYFDHFISRI